MPKLRVHNFALSLDGYPAGPNQSLDNPLGVGGRGLHEWAFATRTYSHMLGIDGGDEGLADEFDAQGDVGVGATTWGATRSAPSADPGATRTGRAGAERSRHPTHPVFVFTHYPRPSITMQGGTTFHFVIDGIDAALDRALAAADCNDVRIGAGRPPSSNSCARA